VTPFSPVMRTILTCQKRLPSNLSTLPELCARDGCPLVRFSTSPFLSTFFPKN
jgi:hypothetical protein